MLKRLKSVSMLLDVYKRQTWSNVQKYCFLLLIWHFYKIKMYNCLLYTSIFLKFIENQVIPFP